MPSFSANCPRPVRYQLQLCPLRRPLDNARRTRRSYARELENSSRFALSPQSISFTGLNAAAVAEATGRKPALSTTGGTSDARFITHHCPVVEFGLVGQTMHQINERVPVADLRALTTIYRKIIDQYFA